MGIWGFESCQVSEPVQSLLRDSQRSAVMPANTGLLLADLSLRVTLSNQHFGFLLKVSTQSLGNSRLAESRTGDKVRREWHPDAAVDHAGIFLLHRHSTFSLEATIAVGTTHGPLSMRQVWFPTE